MKMTRDEHVAYCTCIWN